jgi:hypothetical protein
LKLPFCSLPLLIFLYHTVSAIREPAVSGSISDVWLTENHHLNPLREGNRKPPDVLRRQRNHGFVDYFVILNLDA